MCVRGFVVAPGLEDSPGQLGEALQGLSQDLNQAWAQASLAQGDSLGQQDKALLEETRPWPRLREALGQGEFPDPGEDETG